MKRDPQPDWYDSSCFNRTRGADRAASLWKSIGSQTMIEPLSSFNGTFGDRATLNRTGTIHRASTGRVKSIEPHRTASVFPRIA